MHIHNPIFIPGPTNIPDSIRKACDMASIDHRSPAFAEILQPALQAVKQIIKSKAAEIFLFTGSGTLGWEATLTNCLSPGDKVLIARNGMFSQRWIDMCQRHQLEVQIIEKTWGDAATQADYQEILQNDKNNEIKAVLLTHNETATGVLADIKQVRQAIDAANHSALFFVDAVSSVACMDVRFDEWKIDGLVTGSQKGFMMPAGLAIIALSEKALKATETATLPRTYLDVKDMRNSYKNNSYPYTPAVGMMNGLLVASNMLLTEGLDNVFARHYRLAEGVRKAVQAWGLELCANDAQYYSNSITAIRTPAGFDAGKIVSHAASKYQVAFGVGLGEVAGKVFRIGHLGALTDVIALSGIATAEMTMLDLGLDIKLGAGVAAAQEYYRNN